MRRWIPGMVVLVTLYGFLLRLYALDALSIWLDEAITVYGAKQTLLHGLPLLGSGWLYLAGLPQTYVLALLGWFAGLVVAWPWQEFLMRLPSVLVGTSLIPLLFSMVKKIWNERVGLGAALFMAFNYWQIAWSRQARMYIWLELFVLLGLWWGYRFVEQKRTRDGALAALALVLAVLTHAAGFVAVLGVAILWLSKERTLRLPGNRWAQLCYGLAGGLLAWLGVKAAYSFHRIGYLGQYLTWLHAEYLPLLYLAPLALFLSWKERFLLALGLAYLLAVSELQTLFAYRYTLLLAPLLAVLAVRVLDWKLVRPWLYWPAVVLLVLGSTPLLLPSEAVYLEPDTPQPPWRDVYEHVALLSTPRLVLGENVTFIAQPVVDAHPVIADYYGVAVDGWLKNSLSGKRVKSAQDPYLGVPWTKATGIVVLDDRASVTSDLEGYAGNYTVFGNGTLRRARVYVE